MKNNFPNLPTLLSKKHKTDSFDCNEKSLNEFLKKYALLNIQNSSSRTYVTCVKNKIIGYYTLTYGSIAYEKSPSRISTGLAKHPIPIILLARLAVDKKYQNQGIGKGLLKDVLLRTIQAAEIAGLRAIMVHAKEKKAKEFYIKYGFTPFSMSGFTLYILIKGILKIIKK